MVLRAHPLVTVHRGRMDQAAMEAFLRNGGFSVTVDATHPYARNVTEHIKGAVKDLPVSYLRLLRESGGFPEEGGQKAVRYFESHEACASALCKVKGNILLTTGSKDLAAYCGKESLKNRLYVRVLPGMESLALCMEQGICGKQILALQGPFSTELNEALIRQYRISCLVTKNGGIPGGYPEKLEAAERCGIPVFVIGCEPEEDGDTFWEAVRKLEKLLGCPIRCRKPQEARGLQLPMEILLAGIGMGSEDGLTVEVREAIQSADILLGAERMIAPYRPKVDKRPYYRAEEILPYLRKLCGNFFSDNAALAVKKAVILFSGDTGFYSGCQTLYRALQKEIAAGTLNASVRILPGISSVSWLAACIGENYQDACILSLHGKTQPGLLRKLKQEKGTFLLTSGAEDVRKLGRLLLNGGMSGCEVVTGYQLSYPEQRIETRTPEECLAVFEEGLYTCYVRNPEPEERSLTHGRADSEFFREKVPMTKEEVREVSICKLNLTKDAVVCDIGSGTGSIAVEIAGLSDEISVFALERKKEAVSLIQKNREKFGLTNLTVIEAEAPEGISALPRPTHALIGGSGGRLKEILAVLYEKNPRLRVVINAVSLETICEIREVLSLYPTAGEEVVQLQVSRTRKAGAYHLMQAENPVWICAFHFVPETGAVPKPVSESEKETEPL